ncbi:iron-containing alcohol dehydrogenase [Saccharopolyspora mangrovi]|uniref:Iron-containing alcohol dehydrogenase n=1 Tax=Saccharopolyspora mangrovi TaxID=3082379 RepID=A0ABU6AI82_9PSEU|nr:iron-containing alcohol dehydrogenase [Saccharopolyspora sp. S2-29]MEB3371273.1 iron-containing alcohol dehydrogenase [Saccharopolyspora sp. S2-29]
MADDVLTARSQPAWLPGTGPSPITSRSSVARAGAGPNGRAKAANSGGAAIDIRQHSARGGLHAAAGRCRRRQIGQRSGLHRPVLNRSVTTWRLVPDRTSRAQTADPRARKDPMTGAMSEIVGDFVHDCLPRRTVFGAGVSGTQLASEFDRLAITSVLTVTSPSQVAVAEDLVQQSHRGCAGVVTLRPGENASARSQVVEAIAGSGADCLFAVGGGTVMHVAKEAAALAAVPVVAVPTTYAGAELSSGPEEFLHDQAPGAAQLVPRVVLYDPQLTFSLPDDFTAVSVMTALANGVEALCAPRVSPVFTLLAEDGLRRLADGSPDAILHPNGLIGRSQTQYGGYLAGAAFATVPPGPHHRLCATLADFAELRRADVHAVLLPYSLGAKRTTRPLNLARIAGALGHNDAVQGVRALACDVGAPLSLKELGMDLASLEALTESLPEGTDRICGFEPGGLADLLTNAYDGTPPEQG